MTVALVPLTTTAGGMLFTTPERLTAVWQVSTYRPPTHGSSAFPGLPAPDVVEEAYGFQTRVEIGDGAGAFSVVESVEEVLALRAAAFRRQRRSIFRRVRTVFAKEASWSS